MAPDAGHPGAHTLPLPWAAGSCSRKGRGHVAGVVAGGGSSQLTVTARCFFSFYHLSHVPVTHTRAHTNTRGHAHDMSSRVCLRSACRPVCTGDMSLADTLAHPRHTHTLTRARSRELTCVRDNACAHILQLHTHVLVDTHLHAGVCSRAWLRTPTAPRACEHTSTHARSPSGSRLPRPHPPPSSRRADSRTATGRAGNTAPAAAGGDPPNPRLGPRQPQPLRPERDVQGGKGGPERVHRRPGLSLGSDVLRARGGALGHTLRSSW